MPSTPSSGLSPTNPVPPRVAGINYGIFFQDTTEGTVNPYAFPPNYHMWFSNNVMPTQDVGNAGDWYLMTTADSLVIYQKSSVWTAYTTVTGGTITDETLIYGSIATLNSNVAVLQTDVATLTARVNTLSPGGGGSGSVTSITAGTGLGGGTITTIGTIYLDPAYAGYGIGTANGILQANGSGVVSAVTVTSPLTTGGGGLGIPQANFSISGYLSSADWATFNGKEPGLGNPTVTGSFLTSTAAGVRSWVAPTTGGTVTSIVAGTGLNGGTIITSGTISVATTQNITNLSNLTSQGLVYTGNSGALNVLATGTTGSVVSATPPSGIVGYSTWSALMDWNIGSSQGMITYRGASTWGNLSPGTAGYALITGGASADPSWAHLEAYLGNPSTNGYVLSSTTGGTRSWIAASGSGTVTSIVAGTGLTGGTITTTGTIALGTSGVSAGSYGSAYSVGTFTVDQYGRITAAANTSIAVASPLVNNGSNISIPQASGTSNGFLASTDWSTFNGKQAAYTNLSSIGALANAPGYLYNNGAGGFSYGTVPNTQPGVYNVLNYGASPSASASANTTAINNAIAAAVAAGTGVVYIPSGTYLINNSIVLPNTTPNVFYLVIRGEGHDATALIQTAAYTNGIYIQFPSNTATTSPQIIVTGLSIISSQSTNASGVALAVLYYATTNPVSNGPLVSDVFINSTGGGANGWDAGMQLQHINDGYFENMIISMPSWSGIGVQCIGQMIDTEFNHVKVQGSVYAWMFNNGGPYSMQGIELNSCGGIDCLYGFYAIQSGSGVNGIVGPIHVNGGEFDVNNGNPLNHNTYAVWLSGCINIQFSNSLFGANDTGGGYIGNYLYMTDTTCCPMMGITTYGGVANGINITGTSVQNVLMGWSWQQQPATILLGSSTSYNVVKDFACNGTISVTDSGSNNRSNPNN